MYCHPVGGRCQDFGIYSGTDEELLEESEQRSDMIRLSFFP